MYLCILSLSSGGTFEYSCKLISKKTELILNIDCWYLTSSSNRHRLSTTTISGRFKLVSLYTMNDIHTYEQCLHMTVGLPFTDFFALFS